MFFCRVKSRVVEIPFRRPKVAPATKEEREMRRELEVQMMMGEFGGSVGWAVGMGNQLVEEKEEVEEILAEICQWNKLMEEPRIAQGWALLIYFGKKVFSIYNYDTFNASIILTKLLHEAKLDDNLMDELEQNFSCISNEPQLLMPEQLEQVIIDTVDDLLAHCRKIKDKKKVW